MKPDSINTTTTMAIITLVCADGPKTKFSMNC